MPTLYEEFTDCRKQVFSSRYQPNISKQLVSLFNLICGIDLSSEHDPFISDGSSYGMETTFNYKFKYGRIHVATNKAAMEVIFFFSNPVELSIPFHSNRCNIHVDHNLNLIEGVFHFYSSFTRKTLNNDMDGMAGYSYIRYNRINDGTKLFNRLAYLKHEDNTQKLDEYTDMSLHGINSNYLIPNFEFELLFKKFMRFCEKNPEEFYDVFTEYPNRNQFIDSIEGAVKFLNLFHAQYTDNIGLLKSRLLLLSMQEI